MLRKFVRGFGSDAGGRTLRSSCVAVLATVWAFSGIAHAEIEEEPLPADVVVVLDDAAALFDSDAGRGLAALGNEVGLFEQSSEAWGGLSKAVGLADDEAKRALLAGRSMLLYDRSGDLFGAQWVAVLTVQPEFAKRVSAGLRFSPRRAVGVVPVFAIEKGRFSVALVAPPRRVMLERRAAGEDEATDPPTLVVLGSSGSRDLMTRLLQDLSLAAFRDDWAQAVGVDASRWWGMLAPGDAERRPGVLLAMDLDEDEVGDDGSIPRLVISARPRGAGWVLRGAAPAQAVGVTKEMAGSPLTAGAFERLSKGALAAAYGSVDEAFRLGLEEDEGGIESAIGAGLDSPDWPTRLVSTMRSLVTPLTPPPMRGLGDGSAVAMVSKSEQGGLGVAVASSVTAGERDKALSAATSVAALLGGERLGSEDTAVRTTRVGRTERIEVEFDAPVTRVSGGGAATREQARAGEIEQRRGPFGERVRVGWSFVDAAGKPSGDWMTLSIRAGGEDSDETDVQAGLVEALGGLSPVAGLRPVLAIGVLRPAAFSEALGIGQQSDAARALRLVEQVRWSLTRLPTGDGADGSGGYVFGEVSLAFTAPGVDGQSGKD